MKISDFSSSNAVQNITDAIERAKSSAGNNVFLEISEDRALERARLVEQGKITGQLAGVPFAAKDNFLTFGSKTTAASKFLEDFASPLQSTAVERLEAEGAICIGKVNLDAFAHGGSTENSAFGPTRNATDSKRVAGGSSGGSAVAVALGVVPFALGTDTGGSIRQPASFNGVFGIKPTYGAVSRYGVVAMSSSTDTIGVLSRDAQDAAIVMRIMAGKDTKDMTTIDGVYDVASVAPIKKVAVIKEFMTDQVDDDVKGVVGRYVESLKSAGYDVEEISLPILDYTIAMYYIIVPAEISSNLARYDGVRYGKRADSDNLDDLYGRSRDQGFMPENKRRIMIGSYVLSSGFFDAYYLKAQKARTILINEFAKAFESYDMLIGPVSPSPAYMVGERVNDPMKMYLADLMTVGASLAGLPGASMPAGNTPKGLPVGIQLLAKRGDDMRILQFAQDLETKLS